MSIVFFDDAESSGSQLPFVNEFVRKPNQLGTSHDILSIAPSRKGNGLVVKTESFMIFIWKSSKACQWLLDAVRVGEDECGYPIVAVLKKEDPHYTLGLDTDRTAFFQEEKDDFTGRISYRLNSPPLEMSSKSQPPLPKGKK